MSDAVDAFADPVRFGITAPGQVLGGALPGYGLYPASDGWIALAALEPHFWKGVTNALALEPERGNAEILASMFRTRRASEWEAWAVERGLPIVAVRSQPPAAHNDE